MSRLQTTARQGGTVSATPSIPDELKVFLSCRVEDLKVAKRIKSRLESLGRPRLTVFVSDILPHVTEYRPRVRIELALAQRLILLYTDPTQAWEACLYESGFVDGMAFPDEMVVVIHDSECELPGPLKSFNAVPVSRKNKERLHKF